MVSKTNKVHQRIPLYQIADKGKRSVTFSKRKFGILKKSSELSTLCGSNIALILFSESGRAYSFGNPNTNAIFDRFMGVASERVLDATFHELLKAEKVPHVQYMQAQIMEAEKTLAQEQHLGKTLSLEMTEHAKRKWWEQPIEEMNSLQLTMRKARMEELKMIFKREKQLKMVTKDQNPFLCWL